MLLVAERFVVRDEGGNNMQETDLFDLNLMEQYRNRAARAMHDGADFLLKYVAEEFADRLQMVQRTFSRAVDLFGFNGVVADALQRSNKVDKIIRIETSDIWLTGASHGYTSSRTTIQFPQQNVDLIVSLLSLHLANDILGNLIQINRALRPDGLFMAALLGSGTLHELRDSLLTAETELFGGASPRVSPFGDIKDLGALLQRAGFNLPVTDVDPLTVRYNTMFELMADLRNMGMQNALTGRSHRPVSKRFFTRAAEIYANKYSDPDHRIRATFSIIWLSGWAPAPGQQQPAKPGSARHSLKDVLSKND